ncbi:ATPase [Aureococcus anophagefferens]|nr:ATPase [Aureococcus anophagefferens]
MDAAKAKELKKYTRELLRDHETLSRNLAAAEALAAERQAELDKLQAQAERAPEAGGNNYLFGELCRVKERAQQSEVEARRLSVKLDVAKDLRAVGVRARAPRATAGAECPRNTHLSFERPATYESQRPATFVGSRALAEALASLRRRFAFGEPATARGGGAAAESANRRVDDERRRLLEALRPRRTPRGAHRGAAYRNGGGARRRSSRPSRRAPAPRARSDGGFGPFLLDAARACARLEERRDAQDAVLVACAKAKDAAVGAWLETIGWGRGRLVLLELLNRSVLGFALRCLCVEAAPPLRSAQGAVLHYESGALLLDAPSAARGANRAQAAGVAFQLRHARHAVERLRDAAAPAAAAAEAPEVDDEAASAAGRRASRTGARVRAVRAHGPVAHGVQRRAAAGGVAVTARARGAAAPAGGAAAALDAAAAPWRSVEIDGVGAWVSTGASRARGMDCEVRLRDGPDDHVVVLQWQSRSRKLTWAFEAADDGSSLFRPSSLSPPASPLEEEDDDDDSSADGGEAPAAHRRRRPRSRAIGVATGPEVWAAADAVAGADRALGPVRERWAVVRGDAAVSATTRPTTRRARAAR